MSIPQHLVPPYHDREIAKLSHTDLQLQYSSQNKDSRFQVAFDGHAHAARVLYPDKRQSTVEGGPLCPAGRKRKTSGQVPTRTSILATIACFERQLRNSSPIHQQNVLPRGSCCSDLQAVWVRRYVSRRTHTARVTPRPGCQTAESAAMLGARPRAHPAGNPGKLRPPARRASSPFAGARAPQPGTDRERRQPQGHGCTQPRRSQPV